MQLRTFCGNSISDIAHNMDLNLWWKPTWLTYLVNISVQYRFFFKFINRVSMYLKSLIKTFTNPLLCYPLLSQWPRRQSIRFKKQFECHSGKAIPPKHGPFTQTWIVYNTLQLFFFLIILICSKGMCHSWTDFQTERINKKEWIF